MTVLIDNLTEAPSEGSQRARDLSARYEGMTAQDILRDVIRNEFFGDIVLSSSFGADSAVLLHMISEIDPAFPVLFLDTERHFFQTLQYRDELAAKLGLSNIIVLKANANEAAAEDPKNMLWKSSPDQCCDLRKVRPLNRAMEAYGAWISGRKRHQTSTRAHLPIVEFDGRHYKVNPLAAWTADDIAAYFESHDLPPHPLVEQGFPSIGCFTCTKPVEKGADARSGRWSESEKVECGIHRPIYGGDGI
ncbi:MAG: phosphoadenylyl-sulfate reductase [Asticcacaulis sp.]|nr:phosphoadenylyl-sulfate reductase [Asticcacaulis sp.]